MNKLKIDSKTVVYCEGEFQVIKLFAIAESLGLRWQSGSNYSSVSPRERFAYDLHLGARGFKQYYLELDYNIISLDEFIKIQSSNLTLDSVVEAVREDLLRRSQVGLKKYGTTLDRDDLTLKDWLTHLREELMDATLYIKKIELELDKNDNSRTT